MQQAVALDPNYGLAWSGLADALQLKVINATHFAYIRQLGDSQTVDFSGPKVAVAGSRVMGGAGA